MFMEVFYNKELLSGYMNSINASKLSIGFVPTMGSLHLGHLSLIKKAISENNYVLVSIYVNPTQFESKLDLEKYPKDFDIDVNLLKSLNSNKLSLFIPNDHEIYGDYISKKLFDFEGLDKQMEGKYRPGHFNGVATVLMKLFEYVNPNKAYFGEKDYQQLLIVKRLVNNYKLPISVIGCPIVRDDNGLALSSRNSRLTKDNRIYASKIYRILNRVKENFETLNFFEIKSWVNNQFEMDSTIDLEYFEISEDLTLKTAHKKEKKIKYRAFIAVKISNVRLIDNIALN